MEAIILAGGHGTRLAGRLVGVPKAMAPVAGKPFLEILLCQLERCRCTRALLAVGYLHRVIKDYFGGSFGGMKLEYAVEETLLGTGGAIHSALALARENAVLVLNGDTFLDADYAEMLRFHSEERATLTMAITHQADVARYGGVLVSGRRILGFEEKCRSGPGWINAGAYVLQRDFSWPSALGERFSFEKDFLMREIGHLAPAAYEVKRFFLDIGIPEDLDRAQTELSGFVSASPDDGCAASRRDSHLGKLRTIFLDRDGVVNKKMPEGQYVRSWGEFHLLPGVPEAIARLNQSGLRVVVVSNQRGIARNLYTASDVETIHSELQNLLASHGARVDAFYICPHDDGECNCRKPLPGMFEQAVAEFRDISPTTSAMIGDSLSDMEFGARLGMKTILIERSPGRQDPGIEEARALADQRYCSLTDAVNALFKPGRGSWSNP